MKNYSILTYMGRGMASGNAPSEAMPARLNEGFTNSSNRLFDNTAEDLIRNENGEIIQFVSQVSALNYCINLGWQLEQTIFESHEGFNSRDPLSAFIFILSKES